MNTSMQIVIAFAMVAGCLHADATMSQQYKEVAIMDAASSPLTPGSTGALPPGNVAAGPLTSAGTMPTAGSIGSAAATPVVGDQFGSGSGDLMVAQDPMANHALTGRLQREMELQGYQGQAQYQGQTPAAIKADQFRRLRNELRAQRRKKEEVKQKLERLKDLQRQHLLAKAKVDKHEPKVDTRRAKSYLDAALTKVANDMADGRRQLRVIDRAIKDLNVEHAKTVAKEIQIKRQDALLVVKIQEDQAKQVNLAALMKEESELKAAVDAHRTGATGELLTKISNGGAVQSGLEAQLVDTLAQKTMLSNQVFGPAESDLAPQNVQLSEKSQAYEVPKLLAKAKTAAPAPFPGAAKDAAAQAPPPSPKKDNHAPEVHQVDSDLENEALQEGEGEREELEDTEMAHPEVSLLSVKTGSTFLAVKK